MGHPTTNEWVHFWFGTIFGLVDTKTVQVQTIIFRHFAILLPVRTMSTYLLIISILELGIWISEHPYRAGKACALS
jgi:hypothetical protein